MKIVVVGSSITDMIVKVPRIPCPGGTILGGKFSTAAGGQGANQAVAAAPRGGDVPLTPGFAMICSVSKRAISLMRMMGIIAFTKR